MLLFFDEKTLNLTVKVGALEEYSSTPEVREIVKRSELLRQKRDAFLVEVFEPEMKKLLDIIDRINVTENPQLETLRNQGKPK